MITRIKKAYAFVAFVVFENMTTGQRWHCYGACTWDTKSEAEDSMRCMIRNHVIPGVSVVSREVITIVRRYEVSI